LAPPLAQELENYDSLGFDPAEFERLESDLEAALGELQLDPLLEPFKNEYETLFRALKKSHESERRLIKKCKDLRTEVESHVHKVNGASKLSSEDQTAIANLRKEIERTWKAVDASHEKEARLKELIARLKLELVQLQAAARQESEAQGEKEMMLRELVHKRDDLLRERETCNAQIAVGKGDITDMQDKLRVIDAERLAADAASANLRAQIDSKKSEGERELRRKERLERELIELKARLEARNAEIKAKQVRLAEGAELLGRLDAQTREQRSLADKAGKGYEVLHVRLSQLEAELAEQVRNNAALQLENKHRQTELRTKAEAIELSRGECARLDKLIAALTKKIHGHDDECAKAEAVRGEIRAQIGELERQLELAQRETDGERKTHDDLVRERDILNKNLVKAVISTEKVLDLVKISENEKKNLEHEMAMYHADAHRARTRIHALEREREAVTQEALAATAKHREAVDAVAQKEAEVLELQRRIGEGEAKLKQQQNLYEAVRADCNLYSKNLIEAQEEIAEMKRRFKTMSAQIEQLKDEISSKDSHLAREHFEHMRVDKDKAVIRAQVDETKAKAQDAEGAIAATKGEIAKLHNIINEADAELAKQHKEYSIVLAERDVLGGQLIKRNSELQTLYEQIKLQQSMLRKGEAAYADKLDDIGALKEQVYTLRAELGALRAAVASVPNLKRDVIRLDREVLRERTKVRALQEEFEHPMNVHRWRKLEGSEPATYSMVMRIHTLQRQLIAKTDEVAAKDALIQQKEKLYVELKNILARQPGPEVAEQLSTYNTVFAEKSKQFKAMSSELAAYRAQVGDLKGEATAMARQMATLKKEYFANGMRQRKKLAGADMDAALAEFDRQHEARLQASLAMAGGGAIMPPTAPAAGGEGEE
jgi:chromosome segregation ATPase